MDFFPNLRKAFTIDRQIPLAEIAEWGDLNAITALVEPVCDTLNKRLGKARFCSLAAEVSE